MHTQKQIALSDLPHQRAHIGACAYSPDNDKGLLLGAGSQQLCKLLECVKAVFECRIVALQVGWRWSVGAF